VTQADWKCWLAARLIDGRPPNLTEFDKVAEFVRPLGIILETVDVSSNQTEELIDENGAYYATPTMVVAQHRVRIEGLYDTKE
jgi:hypothetical protein